MKCKIFISYRRNDSNDMVDDIYNLFANELGKGNVFRDVNSIPLGADFREILKSAISNTEIVLVVVGTNWLCTDTETGQRRIDLPDDYVRMEIEMALALDKIVVPLLVNHAQIPTPSQLPDSIRELSFRNASVIRSRYDIECLKDHLNGILRGRHEGYCYLNRKGIDELCTKFGIRAGLELTHGKRVPSIITFLEPVFTSVLVECGCVKF